ncbi:hypothetical protein FNX48_021080, partial [Streptomyces sp. IF17]|nr:hypothetical protein [Streptomyces alkaliphilus]
MTHRRMPNERLRSLLDEADWTQEALARSVNAIGSEIGCPLRYDRTAVAHWLAGTLPREPVPELAAEALSRRIGRPVTPEAAGFGTAAARSPARATASGPTHDTGGDPDRTAGGTDPGDAADGFAATCRADAEGARLAPMRQRPYRVAETEVPGPPNEPADDGGRMFDPRVTPPGPAGPGPGTATPGRDRPRPGRPPRGPAEHTPRPP